jgi:hypothetical protein
VRQLRKFWIAELRPESINAISGIKQPVISQQSEDSGTGPVIGTFCRCPLTGFILHHQIMTEFSIKPVLYNGKRNNSIW